MEVTLADDVDDLLNHLYDAGDVETYDALYDAIELIQAGDRQARRHRLAGAVTRSARATWVMRVVVRGQGWVVVWENVDADHAKVTGVGRSDHRF